MDWVSYTLGFLVGLFGGWLIFANRPKIRLKIESTTIVHREDDA
ncbi:MAG TPA: hypothetical protein VFL54_09125 [Gammaproteobacteria bacterium]|nr:hypothetical protein [Gammaproteobacteria bacterium]